MGEYCRSSTQAKCLLVLPVTRNSLFDRGVMYRLEKNWLARLLVGPAAALVTGFYVYSFVNDPGVDATFRVSLIILSSIGVQLVLFFPPVGVENEDV